MAEESKEQKPSSEVAAPVAKKPKKKKTLPTNCVQSNKRIRRKDWYYRNGNYFANKQCFKIWQETKASEKAKKEIAVDAAKAS